MRLIAEILTPIVAKSRFFRIQGIQGVISNRPYLALEAPTYYRCRTTLIVKQGANGYPIYLRAHQGYLHLDFKVHTSKQAKRKIKTFLHLEAVGKFTTWGYGRIRWILQKTYWDPDGFRIFRPRFRILKGLPADLTFPEQQLIMAALLHDLVDTELHPSKLGRPVQIADPYVQWLCEHHHTTQKNVDNPALQLLRNADMRTSRYARLLTLPTPRRMHVPVDTLQLARQLEAAAQCSVYKVYSFIYHSRELNKLTASKVHPTETLRNHLLGVANWILFWVRTRITTLVVFAGEPGVTPGPVEVEDPRASNEP